MIDFVMGTLPPMCPRSIFLEKQLKSALEGKTIVGANWDKHYTGKYSWHGDTIPNLEKLSGSRIIFADASCCITDNGLLVFYAYTEGGLRYYHNGEQIIIPSVKKSVTHAYYACILLFDGSCLGINQYNWGTIFKVFDVSSEKVNNKYESKNRRYPFILKSPIDITDSEDFTLEKFIKWLAANPGMNIIENCATAKGAFRIDIPVMNYILLISKVHPKTKTRALTDDEIQLIYNNTLSLISDYKSGFKVCRHTDIYGNIIEEQNDVLWMNSKTLSTPCPVCGTLIEAVPAAGTKMYFCPSCQVIKQ